MPRPSIRIAIAIVVALLTSVAITQSSAFASSTVRMSGTVIDSGGYPLAGVTVEVVPANTDDDTEFRPSTTNDRGAFTTPSLAHSTTTKYRLHVTDPTGRHRETYSKAFAATVANETQNVTMGDAGIIRGKVTTKYGDDVQPAADILVTALRQTSEDSESWPSVFTSAGGTFSLGGLPSGTYAVEFEDVDEDGTKPGHRFRSICYDNVKTDSGTCAGAATVEVEAGNVTTINPQVMSSRIGQVSGKVTDSRGKGLPYVTVSIYGATSHHLITDIRAGTTGSWHSSVAPTGDLKIVATDRTGKHRSTWYRKSTSFTTAKPIAYDGTSDVSHLDIVLPAK